MPPDRPGGGADLAVEPVGGTAIRATAASPAGRGSAAACMSTRRSCHLATSARSCARGTRNSLRRSPTCSSSTRSIRKSSLLTVGLTFIGSMNVLAHRQGGRHEVMALFESPMLAERVLGHERVDELAGPPTCPECGMAVRLASARGGKLRWRCWALDGDGTARRVRLGTAVPGPPAHPQSARTAHGRQPGQPEALSKYCPVSGPTRAPAGRRKFAD